MKTDEYERFKEDFKKSWEALPETTKDIINTALRTLDVYDSGNGGAVSSCIRKIARLSGLSEKTLRDSLYSTDNGVRYNLDWLVNAGYQVPQFLIEAKRMRRW